MSLKLPVKITRMYGTGKRFVKGHSPQMCLIGATLLFGYTIYETIKASRHLNEVIDIHKKEMAEVKEIEKKIEEEENSPVTKHDIFIDKCAVRLRTGMRLGKLYWKAAVAGAGSVGGYWAAYKITNGWFMGASAAYVTVKKDLDTLEQRVVDTYGEDALTKLKTAEINLTKEDDEGHLETYKADTDMSSDGIIRFAADTNDNFIAGDLEAMRVFLWSRQCMANERLSALGSLTENETLAIAGFPRSEYKQEGQFRGNVKYKTQEEANKHKADNYIDFGIFEPSEKSGKIAVFKENVVNEYAFGYITIKLNLDPEPVIGKTGWKVK